jgi:hypothetical protein
MLNYSPTAARLKPIFYHFYNEIDVYVEDEHDEVFYEKLFEIILDKKNLVKRVFGVGGKVKLFEAVSEYISNPLGRTRFFIADGDFDWVLRRTIPKTMNLHVLKEYCIENFLLEEHAIYGIIQEEMANKKLQDIKKLFNAKEWLEQNVDQLTPLFASFILIQKKSMGLKNVKNGLGSFIEGKGIPQLEKIKIDAFINSVKALYPNSSTNSFDDEMSIIKKKMGNNWRQRKRHICGKEYLLPLLRLKVKGVTRSDISYDSFRFRILKNCRFRSLSGLKKQIETISNSN